MSIPVEVLRRAPLAPGSVSLQSALVGAVPDVETTFVSLAGPARHVEPGTADRDEIWLILEGRANFRTTGHSYFIEGETIARAPLGWAWTIEVPAQAELVALRITKRIDAEDRAELATAAYGATNAEPHVVQFAACPPYGEAIKSAKTVSRTLLPEGVAPRVAMGTVETTGPDVVARHRHPMLEQLFLGLHSNDSSVSADAADVVFPSFALLHIPLGSMHGASVAAGKKLYYVWMDFFADKAGQAWLKEHRPITGPREGHAR